jgi:hypothetical protein
MKYLKLFEDFQEVDNPHGGEFNFGKLNKEEIEKVKLFIQDLKKVAQENNIKLLLSSESGIRYGEDSNIFCNGYFDGDNRVLACAMGKDISYWLIILLHESSHMDQFLENDPNWTNNIGLVQTDKWLEGSDDVDLDIISEEIRTSINIEIDCERRTIQKIKNWSLEGIIDLEEYIQKSNAYILFYLWMKKRRSWYTIGKEPYNIPEIVSTMPKTLNIDYTQLDPKIEEVFDKYLKKS